MVIHRNPASTKNRENDQYDKASGMSDDAHARNSCSADSHFLDSGIHVDWSSEFLFAMLEILYQARAQLAQNHVDTLQRLHVLLRLEVNMI